jgi:hypothetical protein
MSPRSTLAALGVLLAVRCGAASIDSTSILTTVSDADDHRYIAAISPFSTNPRPVAIIQNTSNNQSPSWSPDRSSFCFLSDASGSFDIYTYRLRDGAVSQITYDGSAGDFPRPQYLSPKEIVYTGVDGQLYSVEPFTRTITPKWAAFPYKPGHVYQLRCGDQNRGYIIEEGAVGRNGGFSSLGTYYLVHDDLVTPLDLTPAFQELGVATLYPDSIAWMPDQPHTLLLLFHFAWRIVSFNLLTDKSVSLAEMLAWELKYSPDWKYLAVMEAASDQGDADILIYGTPFDFHGALERGANAIGHKPGHFVDFDW